VSSRWDDPNWWPKPRRQDKPPTSAAKLFIGTLLPVLAIAGLLIGLSGFKHSGHTASLASTTAVTQERSAGSLDRQAAFEQCVRSAGGGGRSGFGGGRFGGGPSQQFRQAVAVCRSLLQPSAPAPPVSTGPITPPVA
jgi:hypothetical protein